MRKKLKRAELRRLRDLHLIHLVLECGWQMIERDAKIGLVSPDEMHRSMVLGPTGKRKVSVEVIHRAPQDGIIGLFPHQRTMLRRWYRAARERYEATRAKKVVDLTSALDAVDEGGSDGREDD